MITIITSRSYLLCEAINHISLRADPERLHDRGNRLLPYYQIDIDFVPCQRGNSNNQSSRDEHTFVSIRVLGEKTALKFFKEVVQQIREQLPDERYLDKMMEDILNGSKDIYDDTSAATINPPRRKKRRNKAVLQGRGGSGRLRKR